MNVRTIDDRADFVVVQQALSVLGFHEEECQVQWLPWCLVVMVTTVQSLWAIVSGIMHLGNLTYISGGTEESSKLSDTNDISVLAKVMYIQYYHDLSETVYSCSSAPMTYWRDH